MRKTTSTFALVALALLIQPLMPSHVFAAPTSDFNGDGAVNIDDFLLFVGVFGSNRGDGKYDAKYDLDSDGRIGTSDFMIFVGDFGKKVPPSGGGTSDDPFALKWNNLPFQSWWRESAPYSCAPTEKTTSPWIEAGLQDLGGSDPLSLIRFYGNGSYLRYGNQGLDGCTPTVRYPDQMQLDPPADPTYYSVGDLDIWIDIARIPSHAQISDNDDGSRVAMSMAEAVTLMNTHIAPYLQRISGGKLRVTFHPGVEDPDLARKGERVTGSGWYGLARTLLWLRVAPCSSEDQDCHDRGPPGGLNRILFHDITSDTGGNAFNGFGEFGLILLQNADMATILHEIGHGWMGWPHSFTELQSQHYPGGALNAPNPYSNPFDFMSSLVDRVGTAGLGWHPDFPPPLAIDRYSAGWIEANEVALHVAGSRTYRLEKPLERGHQFLVIHSGRQYAFTTLEVLPERPAAFVDHYPKVYDASVPGGQRKFRYDGVLVSRYDQTRGTGTQARFGPALYDTRNPDFNHYVGHGRDDYSLIGDGESRDIGSGVTVSVSKNADGSYNVSVSGGKIAAFEPWCYPIYFSNPPPTPIYDTGCKLDDGQPNPPAPPDDPDPGPVPLDPPDEPGKQFRDCPECPLMVTIPPGSFTMGTPASVVDGFGLNWYVEGPPHQVDIGYRFAVGVYEVTFAEWEACPPCTFYSPEDSGWGRGNRPVINMYWDDAQKYVEWLSSHTGARYRLLSEAEWEYVARAGTTGPFHFGNTISTAQANFNGTRTVPVGSFPANAFGLHDVHGNVEEWTQDCWHGSYAGAPADGSAWTTGDCNRRVLRGGSWQDIWQLVRSSYRAWAGSNSQRNVTGFRVAREIPSR